MHSCSKTQHQEVGLIVQTASELGVKQANEEGSGEDFAHEMKRWVEGGVTQRIWLRLHHMHAT
jgi:hypothetical protein